MSKILNIKAREILDSRGLPTIEVEIRTRTGKFKASSPSGTSSGEHEAAEVRDRDRRFFGQGVLGAVRKIEKVIAPKLKGEKVSNQRKIDEILISLDGTKNKSNLGANSLLAVSVACLRAGARDFKLSLYKYIAQLSGNSNLLKIPYACFNILEGGRHAGNKLNVQEFMVIPLFDSFSENYRAAAEIFYVLKIMLEKKMGRSATNNGYEGGFAPNLSKTGEALSFIAGAIKNLGYQEKIKMGLDVAASEFYCSGKYNFEGKKIGKKEMLSRYQDWVKHYPILFLEDVFSQDDWEGWRRANSKFNASLGGRNSKLLLVGDDLTVTNPNRIKMAKEKQACNGVIIKPNQIGTISETFEAVKLAKLFDWEIIVSHRSGETTDDFIADLAVGVGADFIKAGAPCRGERVSKYNRLLEIEEELLN